MSTATEPNASSPADREDPIERALAAAVQDPGRIGDVLDELSRGQVWVPLPGDRGSVGQASLDDARQVAGPVRPGGAVDLPTVTYRGTEFIPAFTSAARMRQWADATSRAAGLAGDGTDLPHLVVSAVALARLLPARLGIAVNPGAGPSVALSPDGVADLACTQDLRLSA